MTLPSLLHIAWGERATARHMSCIPGAGHHRTVNKHLEHRFGKQGMQTHRVAAAVASQRLRPGLPGRAADTGVADGRAADAGRPESGSNIQVEKKVEPRKKMPSAKSITNACHRLMPNHQASSGTRSTTKPPSKPTACAMRRRTLRPRTVWRDSQYSNAQLNNRFHSTAIAEVATATTPECPALCPVSQASPAVTTTMAISSYSVT